ncbi:hypothetical protein [Streptomyces sp. NPDC055692]|uniref:hypothetical protein n=1 Tax=Streptomyces sp. NPDC055692 TaxID=3155683 RepID=UPI003431306F
MGAVAANGDSPDLLAPAAYPEVGVELTRQAVARAAARCSAGIRCTEPSCLTYGAVKVTLSGAWLCVGCIPVVNAHLAARGFGPCTIQPLPDDARYRVRLFNATGRGASTVTCDTPQRAQFIAETERPFNNTGYEIWVSRPRR